MLVVSSDLDGETRALLALHLVPGLGPRLTKALLERFGSAGRILTASTHELCSVPHIGQKTAEQLVAAMRTVSVDAELALIEQHQVRLLPAHAPDYPASLSMIPDPPALLYLRGTLRAEDRNAVAIVGSRQCSNYGRRIAERLAERLARAGFTVISGLARGIDGAAHRGALAAGGRTIAVLAGGLAGIYPPEHTDLSEEIAVSGALLSETAMAMPPRAELFPARNRLVSGLSRGVVVVEAAEKSGALITARHAAEQGRDVFAVPGPVDSPFSQGTLRLIKDGATLVRDVDDILELWGEPAPAPPKPAPTPPVTLSDSQRRLLEQMTQESIHADALVQRLGLTISEVSNDLILLEMFGLIRRLPGNRFERSE